MFSLEKKGTFEHYLTSFQKELVHTIKNSASIQMKDEYYLKIDEGCKTRAMSYGNEENPDAVMHQMLFRFKFDINADEITVGLRGYSFSNWESPYLIEDRKWGEIEIPLIKAQEKITMPRSLNNRVIKVGLSTGILRKKDTDEEGKCCFVRNQEVGKETPGWLKESCFNEKIKKMVLEAKKVPIAHEDEVVKNGDGGAKPKIKGELKVDLRSDQNNYREMRNHSDHYHESHQSDNRGQESLTPGVKVPMPAAGQRISLLDGHQTEREMAKEERGTENLLRFEMEHGNQHCRPDQRNVIYGPANQNIERPHFRDHNNQNDDGYERPSNNDQRKMQFNEIRTGFNLPPPRQMEESFDRREHPLANPNFSVNMQCYRPRVVEVLGERQHHEKTMQQPHYRGSGAQHQDLNTTWEDSGDGYERVASEHGPSKSQRTMIEEVRRTVGPKRGQHMEPNGERRQNRHFDDPDPRTDLAQQYRANVESLGGNTHFNPQTVTTAYENHGDFAGNKQGRVDPRRYAMEESRDTERRMNRESSAQESKRQRIGEKMANILTVNDKLSRLKIPHSVYGHLDGDPDDDYEMLFMVASTNPELLNKSYETRLAMMNRLEEKLEKVLKEKAEQLQEANNEIDLDLALEKTRYSLRNLGITAHQDLSNLPANEYRRLRKY